MNIKPLLLSLSLLGFGFITNAHAEQAPISQGVDSRVQVFNYNPNDVFRINAKVGYSTLVQFEDGEIIHDDGGLGMGDAKSWSLAVRGSNVFFKPIAEMPDTNMIIVTNKRTYVFQLTTGMGDTTYVARFNYPEELGETQEYQSRKPDVLRKVAVDASGRNILIDDKINTDYLYRGNAHLKPNNVWDDGRFTYLQFAHASDLPTVYRVLDDGTEAIVNTHIKDDVMVIQEVGILYRLRFNKMVGDIGNNKYKLPEFNKTGTSDSNFIRVNQ